MEKETKEVVLSHIKDGTYVSDMMFDIQKLMARADMELYAKPCCDRIEAAGLVDKVHVMRIPTSPWKLQVDADGMEACREILEAYLQPEYLNEMHEIIKGCRDWTISVNNMLYGELIRYPGGFWSWRDVEIKNEIPAWYCDVKTLRALGKRGIVNLDETKKICKLNRCFEN